MRIAVFSDVHANWEALSAVLADIRTAGADALYCLGDVIGYGADPAACFREVASSCGVILRGNHEAALLDPCQRALMNPAAAAALAWTAERLCAAEQAEIARWPLVRVGADARLVHGSPDQPAQFKYLQGRFGLESAFRACPEALCLCGHTHVPLAAEEVVPDVVRLRPEREIALEAGRRYLVNVGSVGQPRHGRPEATWVLVEDRPARVVFHAVSYDVAAAQTKIRRAGLPESLAARLAAGE